MSPKLNEWLYGRAPDGTRSKDIAVQAIQELLEAEKLIASLRSDLEDCSNEKEVLKNAKS